MPIRVLDPTQPPEVLPVTLATRTPPQTPISLALLSNGKTNAVELLRMVKDNLAKQIQIGHAVETEKKSASANAPQVLLDELSESCDLAIVAIGD